ncbi:MAG: hypothetical protein NC111_01320 [Bacteroides sp.]|nr:hypothetical protein [Bacteroides sp.]MCM1413629.1 hypothetical protein [Bacteroides sp.]MCM1471154.1 hypothetical protein [Bacteroides sp.]
MKKIYSILLLVAMLMPVMSFAENKAIKKTVLANYQTTGTRLLVPCTVLEELPAAGSSRDAKPFTFSAWVKLDAYCTASGTQQKGLIFGYGGSLHLNWNGAINLNVSNGGTLNVTGWGTQGTAGDFAGATVALNEWAYLTMVVDNENLVVSVYKNGELVQSKDMSGATEWFNNEDPYIYFAGRGFGGYLDQAEVYNRALSASEVKAAMYNAAKVSGLTALYTFDEIASGSTGKFVNQVSPDDESSYSYWETHNGQNGIDQGGLVNIKSRTEAAPTLTTSDREVLAADINIIPVAASEGGYYTISDGENTWTINDEFTEESISVAVGTDLTFTAYPAEGYQTVGFFTMEGETVNYLEGNTLTAIVDNQMVGVAFTNETYALTVVNDENLPYSISLGDQVIDETNYGTMLGGGAQYKLSLTVPSNKVLNAVRLGETVLAGENGVYLFTLDGDVTLTIDAREKAQYTVTFNQPEGGTIGATYASGTSTVTVASGDKVVEGTVLTLTNTPDAGHTFVGYNVTGATLNGTTVTVNGNVTISGEFEEGIDYCVPTYSSIASAKKTTTSYSGRGISTLSITDGTNTVSITGNGTSGNRDIYKDASATVLTTEPGKTITITAAGAGTWMNTFIYADFDRNGLDFGDQVYTNYDGAEHAYAGTYTFTVPADAAGGSYRVRYIVDWYNNDPCYYRYDINGVTGQPDNGEAFIDFTILIPNQTLENPRTVSVSTPDESLGTVAITSPKNSGTTVTTDAKTVTVQATPAEGVSFVSWTINGEVVSTNATYNYAGETDVELVANFGYAVTWTAGEGGSVSVVSDGTALSNGQAVANGASVTINVNPQGGKTAVVKVNGSMVTLEGNSYTFTIDGAAANIEVEFAEKVNTVTIVTTGNGTIELWTNYNRENANLPAGTQLVNGGLIPNSFTAEEEEAGLSIYLIPNEGETVQSCTYQIGSSIVTVGADDLWSMEAGADFYKSADTKFTLVPTAHLTDNLTVTGVFSANTQGIEEIGIDPADGPVEYYNLQGVRVAADNLVPGFYIVRQGSKAVKVFINK